MKNKKILKEESIDNNNKKGKMAKKNQTPLIIILGIILLFVILSGGGFLYFKLQGSHISKMSTETNFIELGSTFKIFYKIKNTQQTPLEPKIMVQYNETCLQTQSEKTLDKIEGGKEQAYFLGITSVRRIGCSGEHIVTFELYDVDSNNKLDTRAVSFEIVQE